jgi:signal-transduction protein with cAMP-binding, CBS, and nucleotidyltransferase domain
MTELMEIVYFSSNDEVMKTDDTIDGLYIIINGCVDIYGKV